MGTFSIWHWLVVLAVIVLVFGTKKLRNLGGDLGAAVRGFRQGMKEDGKDDAAASTPAASAALPDGQAESRTDAGGAAGGGGAAAGKEEEKAADKRDV